MNLIQTEKQISGKGRILLQWLQVVAGLLIFAFGTYLTIIANIGLAPWDCLAMGIAKHVPFNYGISMTLICISILAIDLLLKERIGYGTLIDALLTGNFVQLFRDILPFHEIHNLFISIILMIISFFIMAIGMMVYMLPEQSCGPRDALLLAIGKRLRKIPIGYVEIMMWIVVVLIGWLLGGPVGIGTLLSMFGYGIVMNIVYSAIHFEPRDLKHRDIIEVTKILIHSS